MNKAEALAYRRKIETAAEQQSDELALQSIELFQPWSDRIGVETPVGKRVQGGELLVYPRINHSSNTVMMYYKIIGERMVFSTCQTIQLIDFVLSKKDKYN